MFKIIATYVRVGHIPAYDRWFLDDCFPDSSPDTEPRQDDIRQLELVVHFQVAIGLDWRVRFLSGM